MMARRRRRRDSARARVGPAAEPRGGGVRRSHRGAGVGLPGWRRRPGSARRGVHMPMWQDAEHRWPQTDVEGGDDAGLCSATMHKRGGVERDVAAEDAEGRISGPSPSGGRRSCDMAGGAV